jgi:hypothetical protein
MSDHKVFGQLIHKTHPRKSDQGVQPGASIRSKGQHLYANIHKLNNYQQPSMPRKTTQALSAMIYATTTRMQECNSQYAKAASLSARQLIAYSLLVRTPFSNKNSLI